MVFFAFIGFDIVATAAEETRNPQRDMPRGIFGSLVVCTVLYVAVSLVVTGMEKYIEAATSARRWPTPSRSVGRALLVRRDQLRRGRRPHLGVMILLLGQTRVFFAMSRDGLLPRAFSQVHPKFGTPYRTTVLLGVIVALSPGSPASGSWRELVNIGTLFAFVVVAIGVVVLRRTRPDLPRAFRAPAGAGAADRCRWCASLWLMINLTAETWLRFADLDGRRLRRLLRLRPLAQPAGGR